jgi:hypothetical protein
MIKSTPIVVDHLEASRLEPRRPRSQVVTGGCFVHRKPATNNAIPTPDSHCSSLAAVSSQWRKTTVARIQDKHCGRPCTPCSPCAHCISPSLTIVEEPRINRPAICHLSLRLRYIRGPDRLCEATNVDKPALSLTSTITKTRVYSNEAVLV